MYAINKGLFGQGHAKTDTLLGKKRRLLVQAFPGF
jgi:hypothetical protein